MYWENQDTDQFFKNSPKLEFALTAKQTSPSSPL
jgi:hypothetical protein